MGTTRYAAPNGAFRLYFAITIKIVFLSSSVVDRTAVCESFTYVWTFQRPWVGFLAAKG
jgi:hypothetical protein